MVLRLLIALMTLMGQMPFSVCTCGAAPTVCEDSRCPLAPPAKPTCSCGHHHTPADANNDPRGGDVVLATTHTHPPEHQPGCPTTEIRTTADSTPAAAPQVVPPEHAAAPVVSFCAAPLPVHHPEEPRVWPPGAPARPLFITLLTLRN